MDQSYSEGPVRIASEGDGLAARSRQPLLSFTRPCCAGVCKLIGGIQGWPLKLLGQAVQSSTSRCGMES